MKKIKELSQRVAASSAPVLIVGESGVGKEVLARYIHAESPRARRPFIKINCAAVPHDLLESELFGHERGSFTGAHQRKEGKFELAAGGTILLDEIGEMDLSLQAKLLHVLEDSTFTRVGGNAPVPMKARVMATTNRPLEEAINTGEFRKDLYFRLKVVRIEIPPLRERTDDIRLLADHLFRSSPDRQGSAVTSLPDRLFEELRQYDWPGNVRELKHVVDRFVILPDIDMVLADLTPDRHLETSIGRDGAGRRAAVALPIGESPLANLVLSNGKIPVKEIGAKAAEEAMKGVVLEVLKETHWNRRRAAARLDICYKTLLNMLDRWEPRTVGTGRRRREALAL